MTIPSLWRGYGAVRFSPTSGSVNLEEQTLPNKCEYAQILWSNYSIPRYIPSWNSCIWTSGNLYKILTTVCGIANLGNDSNVHWPKNG